MRGVLIRLRAAFGVAAVQLRRSPTRTALAVVGIALAVLAVTLLVSVGVGVLDTGEQKFGESNRDLWVTGGPVQLSASTRTPLENTVVDSHDVAATIERRDDVESADPMALQGVYVATDDAEPQLLTAVGIAGRGWGALVDEGDGFSAVDAHYANGTYDGPMTREVIIDPRTAELLDVSVGDTIYVGASRESVRNQEFTVVGIASDVSQLLGTSTVALPLGELQQITGTTGADRATFVTVRLRDGADPAAVRQDIQETYPEYEVRTNREQLQSIVGNNAVIIASASSLVVLAVVAGVALTVNLLALVVHQLRPQIAALRAIGLDQSTLVAMVAAQGLLLGFAGGALGLAATPVAVRGLNVVAEAVVGFESLLSTPPVVYLGGFVLAVGIGTVAAAVAGWQLTRIAPLTDLDR